MAIVTAAEAVQEEAGGPSSQPNGNHTSEPGLSKSWNGPGSIQRYYGSIFATTILVASLVLHRLSPT